MKLLRDESFDHSISGKTLDLIMSIDIVVSKHQNEIFFFVIFL